MITIYSKMELQEFLMTHEMINSNYSPPLERKGGIWLIFEKGDRIIYDNMNYLYIGKIANMTKLPRDLACFYKLGNQMRCYTPKEKDKYFLKYYLEFKERERKRLLEMNERASSETKNYISQKARENNERYKKRREDKLRYEMINFLGGRCSVCGKKYGLSFVHKDPKEKTAPVSRLIKENRSREAIYEEVLKCVLMCEDCRQKFFKSLYAKK